MNRSKHILLSAGLLLGVIFTGPIMNDMATLTTYAAEQTLPYSPNWETQPDGSWKYKYNTGGYAVDRWIHDEVDGNWYLIGSDGIMLHGVVKSYGKLYLLNENHDGSFGRMLKNGEVYQGITISAETSGDYEGALSTDTINALRSIGVNVDNVIDVSGTQHTTAGEDEPTTPQPSQETPSQTTDNSLNSEENRQKIMDQYFGGENGKLGTTGDHPLSD